jgi:transposase-like protein
MMQKKQKAENDARHGRTYPSELKLKVVKLYLEEEYTAEMIAEEFDISVWSVREWARQFKERERQV